MLDASRLEYHEVNGIERYKGYLDNGDIVELSCYGNYENRASKWSWRVYVAQDYPVQCYQANEYAGMSIDEAIADFERKYRGRSWRSRWERDPVEYECLSCGCIVNENSIEHVTVYEDYGDVSCWKCPECGKIEYDGTELFREV